MTRIWLARTADVSRADCAAVLSPDEHLAADARLGEALRHETRVTRALTRIALADALDTDPRSLRFIRDAYGKPHLDTGALHFNATNTVALVAVAVSTQAVGIDAEPLASAPRIREVAATVFTAAELAEPDRDVARWTLKEAYMKARGLGFSLPPRSFAIRFVPAPVLVVDDPLPWRLSEIAAGDHALALCALDPAPYVVATFTSRVPDL